MKQGATPHLSPEARRLSAVLQQLGGDRFLEALISIATGDVVSFDQEVTVLSAGHLIRGRLSNPETFARSLDAHLVRSVQAAQIHVDGAREEQSNKIRAALVSSFQSAFTDQVALRRRQTARARDELEKVWGSHEAWDENNPPSIDDLPDGLVRLALLEQSPVRSFTLDQAEIRTGGIWEPIGLTRVMMSEIAAWWIPGLETVSRQVESPGVS